MQDFKIPLPKEFDFDQCLGFLKRSPKEILHQCNDRSVVKLIRIEKEEVLFEIRNADAHHLQVTVLNTKLTSNQRSDLENYIREWFDLETDLKPFYTMVKKDPLLKDLVKKFYGYRIIGQPDLFESLVWAVLGQQINLQFAYTLKQRFVEKFGEKMIFEDHPYFLFPRPATVAILNDELLLPLQFSRQKSKYVVLIAEAFASGEISKEKLQGLSLQTAKEKLMKIKGIGNWTANYALMKTFRYPDAFPLEDAGLHNAIKNLKGLDAKPTLDQVSRIFKKYKGWEAYATLYLWKSL
jgi:DNA-3-methyladenine glycosylase II